MDISAASLCCIGPGYINSFAIFNHQSDEVQSLFEVPKVIAL